MHQLIHFLFQYISYNITYFLIQFADFVIQYFTLQINYLIKISRTSNKPMFMQSFTELLLIGE